MHKCRPCPNYCWLLAFTLDMRKLLIRYLMPPRPSFLGLDIVQSPARSVPCCQVQQ